MEPTLTQKTKKGFFWLFSGSGLQSILQITVLAVLARHVEADEFGIAQAALIFIGLANLLSQMGVGPAVVQNKELTKNHIRAAFTLSFFSGLILGLTTYLLSGPISLFFGMPELEKVMEYLSIIFVLESFVIVSQSLLQRKMRFRAIAFINILSYALGYGAVGIILAIMGYGYWALVYSVIAQVVVKGIIVSIAEPHSCLFLFRKKEILELANYGVGHTIAKIANYFSGQGDNIIIGRYLGSEALGIYGRAYTLMVKPYGLIANAMDSALFPAMCAAQDNKKKLLVAYKKGVSALGMILMPLTLVFIVFAKEIVLILLGDNWLDAVLPLQILSLSILTRISSRISDVLVRAVGIMYKRAWRKAFYAFLVFGGSYIGQEYGVAGVAVAIVFANFCNFLLMAHLTIKHLAFSWKGFFSIQLPGLVIAVVFGTFLLIVNKFAKLITDNNFVLILISLVISISLILIFITQLRKYFFKDTFQLVFSLIKK